MTANIDKQQKFIELRAEGKSFDEIAKRVQISKPTLIKWSKEFKGQIAEVSRIIEEQFIIEQKVKRTLRAQLLSDELEKAYAALKNTDYKDMSKKELIGTIEKLENKLNKIIGFNTLIGFNPISGKPKEFKEWLDDRTNYDNEEPPFPAM